MGSLGLSAKSLLFAGVVCAVGAAGEALCAGKRSNAIMRSLKQPSWAAPMPIWYLIGLAYYSACFMSLYRVAMIDPGTLRLVTLALVTAVMATNAAWNFIFFRRQDWKLSFWYLMPYSALALTTMYALSRADGLSALFFVVYLFYLPYAFAWTYRVWKLNG